MDLRRRVQHAIRALALTQDGLFTRAQLIALGVPEATIDTRLRLLIYKFWLPGVYSDPGLPETWDRRVLAAVLATDGKGMASRTSAAYLMRLGDISQPERIDITVPRGRYPELPVGVHTSMTITPDDYSRVGCIPVACIERVIVELAGCVNGKLLMSCINHAIVDGMTTVDRILQKRYQMGAVSGAKRIDVLTGKVDPEAVKHDSQLELRTLRVILKGGLPRPALNVSVYTEDGRFVARPDMSYPRLRIALESQSKKHHSTAWQMEADEERRAKLEAIGWIVIFITAADLRDPERLWARIREAIAIQTVRYGVAV